jgi:hypothetical protein
LRLTQPGGRFESGRPHSDQGTIVVAAVGPAELARFSMWSDALLLAPYAAIASGIVLGIAVGFVCWSRAYRPGNRGAP